MLLRHGERIPADMRAEHEERLKELLGVPELDQERLRAAAKVDPSKPKENFMSHGEKVVRAVLEMQGGIDAFVREWRASFCDWLGPQNHLPAHWRVENRVCST